jgi:hypothetical protein
MSWFSRLLGRAKTVWIRDVKPAVADAIDAFEAQFGAYAYAAVSQLALSTLTGQQKFDEAVKQLGKEAKSKGWQIGESILRLLIQKAYVNFKASNDTLDLTPPSN